MRMHAWVVYSFIKGAQAVHVNLAVLAEKIGYVAWLVFFMQFLSTLITVII